MAFTESLGVASVLVGATALVGYWRIRRCPGDSARSNVRTEALGIGEHPVLDGPAVIRECGASELVGALQIKLGMPPEVFEQSVQPLIEAYAAFVQCMTLSSVHEAKPSPMLLRALRCVHAALERRRSQILPLGAAPEDIGALAHRWSYALMVVALVEAAREGLGRSVVRYRTVDRREWRRWAPPAGSLAAHGALVYQVDDGTASAEPSCLLGFTLLHGCVPPATLAWLGEDARVFDCLGAVLSRRTSPDAQLLLSLLGSPTQAAPSEPDESVTGKPRRDDAHAKRTVSDAASVSGGMMLAPLWPAPAAAHTLDADTTTFLRWLKDALGAGTLVVNAPEAPVHGIEGGLLLVTPAIFQTFAKAQCADPVSAATFSDTSARLRTIQRGVVRAGAMTDAPTKTVFEWRTRDGGVERIHGIVLHDPERFGIERPAINSRLVAIGSESA